MKTLQRSSEPSATSVSTARQQVSGLVEVVEALGRLRLGRTRSMARGCARYLLDAKIAKLDPVTVAEKANVPGSAL